MDIICRLLCAKMTKYGVCLVYYDSHEAIFSCYYSRYTEDLLSSTIICIEKSVSIFKGRISLLYNLSEKSILFISVFDAIKEVSHFLYMFPQLRSI